ncbi:hypothetical protein [Sphingomonas sp.]
MRKIVVPAKHERPAAPRASAPVQGNGRPRLALRYGRQPPSEERDDS